MLAVLLCIWLPCHAQFGSNVQGTVSDATGAVIPQVAVTLHNTATSVDLKGTTNASGFYRFEAVAPGDYKVIAQQPGFKTTSISVTVTPDETRGVDVKLVPAGAGTVNVTVNGVAPDLNPEETRIEVTLASDEITKLPMAGHDVQQILALTPGVTGFEPTQPGGGYGATLFAGNWAPPFQANGQGINGNLYLLDDLPVNDDVTQGAAIMFPNADMIDQVSMQTQTFSVENGISASLQTTFNTKSGANKFHGDLDYTYAGANLAAADNVDNTINTPGGVPTGAPFVAGVGDFHQNELLGSIGGPIVKDKTFFFFSFQKQNQGSGGTSTTGQDDWDPAFVAWGLSAFPNSGAAEGMSMAPNSADKPGPSYAVKTVADVLGTTACPTSSTTYTSTLPTFVNGALSGPNSGATQGGQAYSILCSTAMYDHGQVFNQAQPFNGLQFSARLDQVFRNGQDRIYAMFERIHQTLGDLTDRPALDSTTPSTNRYGSVNWIHQFSPRLLNEIHVGNVRTVSGQTLTDPTIAGSIPYGNLGLDTTDGYSFYFMFGSDEPFAPDTQFEHTYNLRDTVSYNWHNHTIRGGYQFTREDYLIDDQLYGRGGFGFNFTNAFQLMANEANYTSYLWTISGLTGTYSPQNYGATSKFNGIWADDSWKVRPNLTITAGLRYDDYGNPARYSISSPFSPLYPGAGSNFHEQALNTTVHVSNNAFTQSQALNFQPRVGFAYTPFKDKQLTIHGGIGLYENALTPEQVANNLPTQPPSRISLSLNNPFGYGDFTTAAAPWGQTYDNQLPFPVYGQDPSGNVYSCPAKTDTPSCIYSVNLNGFEPNVKPEKFLLYSAGVEYELPARVVVGASYSGSHGYDLVVGGVGQGPNGVSNADWNLMPGLTTRPASEWGQLLYTTNDGTTSNFNALIFTLKQHYKGLSYQANYNFESAKQWAPTYDDTSGGNKAFWPGAYAAHTYYGPTSTDIENSFSFGGSYEVPKFAPNEHYLNQLAGLRISTITVAQTGTPFSVGNTSGPSYAYDNSLGIDGGGTGTPAFPTPSAGTQRKGFSRKQVSQTGVFTGVTWTDPTGAGTAPVLSTQGANTFRNPGYFNVNAAIAKTYDVPWIGDSSSKFTLRADFINVLNRTNWGAIDNDIASSPNFGFSTSTYNKRFLQVGGRFEF
ncbi:MAG: TonB-dependent receptor [Terracidiphilus sp.]|jgi:hypothetical protein